MRKEKEKDVLVICYRSIETGGEEPPVWERVFAVKTKKRGRKGKRGAKTAVRLVAEEIGREEAERIIAGRGLVLVRDEGYGKIWDTPDGSFRRRYRGLAVPEERPYETRRPVPGKNPSQFANCDKKVL